MKFRLTSGRLVWRFASVSLIGLTTVFAQQTPPASGSSAIEDEDEIVELDPFSVTADTDRGYMATETLAGTRLRTELRDLAAPLQVITEQFLKDTGSKRNEDLLVYTTNTEVGGLYGNFAGVGNVQGASEGTNLLRPHQNTRVRGLDSADNTRNFFLTDVPWDSYIVDRVDIQRGPNSILFGVGSPAGIINSSTMPASFVNSGNVENVLDTLGSVRTSFNVNRNLVDDLLAVRVAGLYDKIKYTQEPAFTDDSRVYGALTFQPKIFGDNHGRFTVRGSFEIGDIESNRPRMLPPTDKITPFWTGLNKQVYDPAWSWSHGAQIDRGNTGKAAQNPEVNEPWLGNEMSGITGGAPAMFFENGASQPFLFKATGANTSFGIGSNGAIDRTIGGYAFGRRQEVAGFNEYTRNANADNPAMFPGAAKNFYKDKSLTNTSVFNFYDELIDGNNKSEYTDWTSFNIGLSQTIFDNRFGAEFVYDVQDLNRGSQGLFGGSTFLGVDIDTHTNLIPTEFPRPVDGEGNPLPYPNADPDDPDDIGFPAADTVVGGDPNPQVGRAYVSGGGGANGNDSNLTRTNYRLTGYGEFYGSDVFDEDSFLAKLIGRNTFTLLGSREEREYFDRSYNLFATDINWATVQDIPIGITEYPRRVPYVVYLSGDLRNTMGPGAADIGRIQSYINPHGQYVAEYFDSHWNRPTDPEAEGYVDPAAPYVLPIDGGASTQSENWRNYVGWTSMPVDILNAREGDRNQLYRSATRRDERLDSYGITWQGRLFDGTIIPTVGWRHDEIETWGAAGARAPGTNVVSTSFDNPRIPGEIIMTEGDTVSWGVVAHAPGFLEDKTPFGLRLSAFYNSSENFRAENRVGFDTLPLPAPQGESKDYGIVISTRDNRYSFKATYFDTAVTDANIPGGNTLGSNVWFLSLIEAWGTASALTSELYWNNELPGMNWFSNYGLIDNNKWGDAVWEDVTNEVPLSDPANQKLFAGIQDWYATMPPQSLYDGYGLPINRAKAQGTLDDRKTMVDNGNWNPYNGIGSIQSSTGGLVNGLSPTGTINQRSEGYEFEFTAQPIDSLNLSINVAKTTAQRTDLGTQLVEWIEFQKDRFDGPAGDLRMWWGGDSTIRKYYDDFIYQAYLFQLDANGQDAAEIRPWRFNFVGNYSFSTDRLKGLNVGMGYRWQDEVILGYRLDSTKTKLDVTNPINGASEDAIDLWAGYEFDITDSIRWRIQINVRNLFDDQHLIPVSVNPDGVVATWRIADGERWSLTNTFSF